MLKTKGLDQVSRILCAWCDQTAIGTALWSNPIFRFPSCGNINHGRDFVYFRNAPGVTFNLVDHIDRHMTWSEETFGPGTRTTSIIKHLGKELEEVEAAPGDLMEWIDIITLGIDGAWRAGHTPEQIAQALGAKLTENEQRQWPDWRTAPPDQPIEHIREESK